MFNSIAWMANRLLFYEKRVRSENTRQNVRVRLAFSPWVNMSQEGVILLANVCITKCNGDASRVEFNV